MKTLARIAMPLLAAVLALGTAGPAGAEATQVSASGFLVTARHELKAPPPRVYAALGEIERWWNPAHSYSGQAANLSLARQPGGCFCERWGAHGVEHARVVMALEDRMLRLEGALGPLAGAGGQRRPRPSPWRPKDGGTTLVVTYRVAGNEGSGLQQLAGPVDGVITEQVRRLVAYVETGKPD